MNPDQPSGVNGLVELAMMIPDYGLIAQILVMRGKEMDKRVETAANGKR